MLTQQALLLTREEGFTPQQAATILGTHSEDVRNRADVARRHLGLDAQARVLVVAVPEGGIVANVVSGLRHRVIGPFDRLDSALIRTASSKPGLVVASAPTADAALEIRAFYDCPLILITNNPEELVARGIPRKSIITRPYELNALALAINKALSIEAEDGSNSEKAEDADAGTEEPPFGPMEVVTTRVLEEAIEWRAGPVDADLIGGQLSLIEAERADAQIDHAALDALREDHLRDVQRILPLASNIGPSFTARLETLASLLADPLTQQSALRIGNQVTVLATMKAATEEMLGNESAADVKAVIDALGKFCRQFQIWRTFLEEAKATKPLTMEQQQALEAVSRVIQAQPDALVAPELKSAIAEVQAVQAEAPGPASGLAFARAISNPLRAILRYVIARAKGAGGEFSKALDKAIGEGLASGTVTVFIAASTPLLSLAVEMPSEFAWAGPLLALIRLARSK